MPVVLRQRDPGVTGGTQRHEVPFGVGATFGQRENMVYLLRRGKPPVPLALLAERVRGDEAFAYTLPRVTVTLSGSRVTAVSLILPCILFGVGLAEPAGGQAWTTGVGAGFLWFIRRNKHSSRNKIAYIRKNIKRNG